MAPKAVAKGENMKKIARFVSLLLALVLTVSVVSPFEVKAEEGTPEEETSEYKAAEKGSIGGYIDYYYDELRDGVCLSFVEEQSDGRIIGYHWYVWNEETVGWDPIETADEATCFLEDIRPRRYRIEVIYTTDESNTLSEFFETTVYIDNLTVQEPDTWIPVFAGETARMEVLASAKRGTVSYKWEIGHKELEEKGNTLDLENVQKNTVVLCTVSDEFGRNYYIEFHVICRQLAELLLDTETPVSGYANYPEPKYAPLVLAFTPEEDGAYRFYSYDKNDCDPASWLYDDQGSLIRSGDDEAGDLNFAVNAELEAGKTYYLYVGAYQSFSYKVKVEKTAMICITLNASGGFFDSPGQETTEAFIFAEEGALSELIPPTHSN